MKTPENVRTFVDKQSIVALATASADGVPNTAPIHWKLWFDASTLLLLDNYMNNTTSNIKSTGKASVSAWNAESGEAYQVKGSAEYVTDGPFMQAAVEHMQKTKPGKSPRGTVVIRIEDVFIQTPGEQAGNRL